MQDATLLFVIDGKPCQTVLLGFKKSGFGAGKYGGFGGKVRAGETVAEAATRELEEETGLQVSQEALWPAGHLTFLFPARPAWNQVVHLFVATSWEGEPRESVEMRPRWFGIDEIPYQRMWQDGIHWLPPVLAGKRVRGCFTFQADNETVAEVELEVKERLPRRLDK